MEKNRIDKVTYSLLEKSVNRILTYEFKNSLKNAGFLSNDKKNHQDLNIMTNFKIKDLLDHYNNKIFVKKRLRKIMGKKLLNYENVGFHARKELWFQVSDAKLVQNLSPKEYYEILRDKFRDIPVRFDELIELDLYRTASLPQDLDDREHHEIKLKKCGNILKTYVKRNPDLGYCQGLNYIAWELIARFEEEEAFWVLTVLLENYLPLDYYTSMKGVLIDQKIFGVLVGMTIPEVFLKFKECNLDCSIFSIQWFVCLFCKTLNQNKEIMDIVFDNLLIQGNIALFKVGIAVLKWLKPTIIASKDFPQLLKLLEQGITNLNDGLRFQELINETYISKKLLQMARNSIMNEESNKPKKKQSVCFFESSKKKIKESQMICNIEYNYCLTQMELNFSKDEYRFSGDFYIFKQDTRIWQKNDDYILTENQKKLNKILPKGKGKDWTPSKSIFRGDLIKQKDSLLLVRHQHVCTLDFRKKIMGSPKKNEENYMLFKNVFNDKKVISFENNKQNRTQSEQTPSTQTPEKPGSQKNNKSYEKVEIQSLETEKLRISIKSLEEEGSKMKNSLMILRKNGVFHNFDEGALEKFWPEIKNSESFCFNKSFIEFK